MAVLSEDDIKAACQHGGQDIVSDIGMCLVLLHPGDGMWLPQIGERAAVDKERVNSVTRDLVYRVGFGLGMWLRPTAPLHPSVLSEENHPVLCSHGVDAHKEDGRG
jgi:hypothetical protein